MSSVFRQKAHHVFLQHARPPRAQLPPASHGPVRAPAVHSPIAQCLRNTNSSQQEGVFGHTYIRRRLLTLSQRFNLKTTTATTTTTTTITTVTATATSNQKDKTPSLLMHTGKKQLSADLFGAPPTYHLNQVQAWWYSC